MIQWNQKTEGKTPEWLIENIYIPCCEYWKEEYDKLKSQTEEPLPTTGIRSEKWFHRFKSELLAHSDRLLRDKGVASKEVEDCLSIAIDDVKQYFPTHKPPTTGIEEQEVFTKKDIKSALAFGAHEVMTKGMGGCSLVWHFAGRIFPDFLKSIKKESPQPKPQEQGLSTPLLEWYFENVKPQEHKSQEDRIKKVIDWCDINSQKVLNSKYERAYTDAIKHTKKFLLSLQGE